DSSTLQHIAERHNATPAQVALAWVLRQDGVLAIPKAVNLEHVRLNAAAAELKLDEHDLDAIDRVFVPPKRKHRLAMV
ncbi:aldo/keto reductase, partial [Pseudomonas sp. IPO3779]